VSRLYGRNRGHKYINNLTVTGSRIKANGLFVDYVYYVYLVDWAANIGAGLQGIMYYYLIGLIKFIG